jgi:hypothetical protein
MLCFSKLMLLIPASHFGAVGCLFGAVLAQYGALRAHSEAKEADFGIKVADSGAMNVWSGIYRHSIFYPGASSRPVGS